MTRYGLPAANTASGTSRVTTLPAPITALEPHLLPFDGGRHPAVFRGQFSLTHALTYALTHQFTNCLGAFRLYSRPLSALTFRLQHTGGAS
jgi:hypothetical protein